MKKSQFIAAELETLDFSERQSRAIKLFNQAMEENDHATAIDVAEFVIGDECMKDEFAAGFQMHCLGWLVRHHRQLYSETEDGSVEEDFYLEKLFEILWKFKWVIAHLPYDINMNRDEMQDANELMSLFYEHFELAQSAVAKTLMHQSLKMGDVQAAKQHFEMWQSGKHDLSNDCDACEQHSLVEYHHFIGDYAAVIELAKPILSGAMHCGEVPHATYQFVIDSLIRLNQTDKAHELLLQAIDLITEDIDEHLSLLAPLIYLCSRVGQPNVAKDLLDEYNDDILELAHNNRLYYLDYLIAVAPFNDEGLVEAQKVATQFDERNGNSFYQDKLALMFGKMRVH